jgi:hypothetical protein
MRTDFRTSPVCIFSFNRPQYLRDTLLSIKSSMKIFGMVGPVILFQDGSLSPYTEIMKCDPKLIQESMDMFRDIMPHGVIFEAPSNLGIAANIYRAEKWAFEEMRYDVSIFFEDDMVVAPRYFEAMAKLNHVAEQEPRVAMFAAYGSDGKMTPADQHLKRASVNSMHHNWVAWEAREYHTKTYMNIIKDNDYRQRSPYRIASWYMEMGWPPLATNQDIAKSVSLNHICMIRITTNVILSRYIGRIGEHYTDEEFDRIGFSDVAVYSDTYPDEEVRLAPLTEADVDRLWMEQRQTLLGTRLATDQLLLSQEISMSAQIITALGVDKFFRSKTGGYLDFVSGIYGDLWCNARSSMTVRSTVDVRIIEISGQIASHLPRNTIIRFSLNGEEVISLDNHRKSFLAIIKIGPHLRSLNKIIATSCSVVSDPFSAGAGPDRRPLSFHIESITLRTPTTDIVLTGTELAAEATHLE